MSTSNPSTQYLTEARDMSKKYPQFLLLGDSIVQNMSLLRDGVCMVSSLAEHCDRRLDIVNRGLSGYNTANELVVLPHLVPSPSCAKVDYLLILFGANDACLPSSPTKQHVPLEKYKENLRTIITHPSVRAHKPKILLVTPPPINEHQLLTGDKEKGFAELTRKAEVTERYAAVVSEVAQEVQFWKDDIVVVDLHSALIKQAWTEEISESNNIILGSLSRYDSPGLRSLLVDGLHLTGAGYSVFLRELLPHIGAEWKNEPANNPSWIFPHWSIAPRID